VVAYRLPDHDAIAEYLAVFYKLPEEDAHRRAATLPAPLPITKRGIYVWATNGVDGARRS
jgi:hypothetical protein